MKLKTLAIGAAVGIGVIAAGLTVFVVASGGPDAVIGRLINPGPPTAGATMEASGIRAEAVAEDLEHPWGLAFLPDGRMLVTERPGRLRIVASNGALSEPLTGVPAVLDAGQGGLLDVAIGPEFEKDGRIFLSYAEPDPANPSLSGTAVASARLNGNALEDVKVIWRQTPKVESDSHWGSRLVFAPAPAGAPQAHVLFITTGDRFDYRDRAQRLDNTFGKIIRIYPDGAVPSDNPFIGRPDVLPEIYSYGHRNIQGAALQPGTGTLWIHEHGPMGGDEINIVQPGGNFGWPLVTKGVEYVVGQRIGVPEPIDGTIAPALTWTPSIAPSGLVFVTSERYPQWRGNLLAGALAHMQLVRVDVARVEPQEVGRLLGDLDERIRDVREGPDGFLYVLTDSPEGRLLRLAPTQ